MSDTNILAGRVRAIPRNLLSLRARKLLLRCGVETIADVLCLTEDDLLAAKNCGPITIRDVNNFLAAYGLALRKPLDEWAEAMNDHTWAVIAESDLPKSIDLVTVCDTEARARLMSAAPELLRSCKRLLEYVDDEYGFLLTKPGGSEDGVVDVIMDARAAITKAEPKTPPPTEKKP